MACCVLICHWHYFNPAGGRLNGLLAVGMIMINKLKHALVLSLRTRWTVTIRLAR